MIILLDSVLCNALGKISLISGNGEYYVYIVACELVDLCEESAQSIVISSAYLEDRVNKDILDIVVACNESCNKAEESFKGIDSVNVGVNDPYTVRNIVSELIALINANNVTIGVLGSSVDHVDQNLSFSGTLITCNDLYHNYSILSGEDYFFGAALLTDKTPLCSLARRTGSLLFKTQHSLYTHPVGG